MTETPQYKKIKIGALWEHTAKNGTKYLSGKLTADVQIFPNGFKKQDNDPVYYIYATEKAKPAQQSKLGAMDFGKDELFIPPKDGLDVTSDIPF